MLGRVAHKTPADPRYKRAEVRRAAADFQASAAHQDTADSQPQEVRRIRVDFQARAERRGQAAQFQVSAALVPQLARRQAVERQAQAGHPA